MAPRPARHFGCLAMVIVGVVILGGLGWIVATAFNDNGMYVHRYAAPGTGCGDRAEADNGEMTDLWDNPDRATIRCFTDHVVMTPGDSIGRSLFATESTIDVTRRSDIADRGYVGFQVQVVAATPTGPLGSLTGITVAPRPKDPAPFDYPYPRYLFAVDSSGSWHVRRYDRFGTFTTEIAATTVGGQPGRHTLTVRVTDSTGTIDFTVDGALAYRLRIASFAGATVGVGMGCPVDPNTDDPPRPLDGCAADLRSYAFTLWPAKT